MDPQGSEPEEKDVIARRMLGKTGETISAIGMGGYALGFPGDPRERVRMIHAAVEGGITFVESSWDYHAGESDRRLGEALRGGYRDRVFLATQIDARTRKAATAQLDQSLKRLQTDRLDLLLLHEIIRPEDPDWVFGPGGAMEALVAAQEAGKVRFLGFSGHKDPQIHLSMLAMGFDFDAVQMPLNLFDAQFRSFEKAVLPTLVERGIGALGMKPMAGGKLLDPGGIKAHDALRYAMSLPVASIVADFPAMTDLRLALDLLGDFAPMDPDEVDFFLRKTATLAQEGRCEEYKTTPAHDLTFQNPDWLTALA